VTVNLDVLVAEDPWADVVMGNWNQGSVAPWVAGASEVGLLHLDGTCLKMAGMASPLVDQVV